MSNLRSDCRYLVKDLPAGDVMRSHVERLCYQIDELEERWHKAEKRIQTIREKLASIVVTEGCDAGVVLLDVYGTTHTETINDRQVQVYDHQYFSPLGDALMELYELAK